MAQISSDSFVEVPGGSLFVRQWSSSRCSGAPIVLMHDSLGCVGMWRDFPEHLAEALERPVVAYDRLGFGRSTLRLQEPSIDFIDAEAECFFPALRASLGLKRFSLFGHSVGGAMALRISPSMQDSCDAVITESAQCFVEARTLEGIRAAMTTFSDSEQLEKLARWHGDRTQWVLDAWTKVWLSPEFSHCANRMACPEGRPAV